MLGTCTWVPYVVYLCLHVHALCMLYVCVMYVCVLYYSTQQAIVNPVGTNR